MIRWPRVNGILETSLYVESAARSAEFYQRVFGFEVIDFDGERLDDGTRLCVMAAGDRDVLLLFKEEALLAPTLMGPSILPLGSLVLSWLLGENGLLTRASRLRTRRLGSTAARHFTSVTPMATFWKLSLQACGLSTNY